MFFNQTQSQIGEPSQQQQQIIKPKLDQILRSLPKDVPFTRFQNKTNLGSDTKNMDDINTYQTGGFLEEDKKPSRLTNNNNDL